MDGLARDQDVMMARLEVRRPGQARTEDESGARSRISVRQGREGRQSGAERKLANEKPRGENVDYDELQRPDANGPASQKEELTIPDTNGAGPARPFRIRTGTPTHEQACFVIDQGTTSTRSMNFGPDACVVPTAQEEVPANLSSAGLGRDGPDSLRRTTLSTARQALLRAGLEPSALAGLGITNQRETTSVWSWIIGRPIYNAIVWQIAACRRLR